MRIGIFTNNYLPNPYGVSTSVEGFRKGLVAAGHEVYIFAPEWGDAMTSTKNVFRYPSVGLPTKVPFSLVVPYAPKIDKEIGALKLDIIHAQHPNLLGGQAQRWAQKKDIPLIFTWHSLYDRYAHYAPLVPEKIAAQWALRNALAFAHSADHVIVPTPSVQKIVEARGLVHHDVSVVPSGVDESLFADANGAKIRAQHNIPVQAPVFVSISRLTEEKNVLFLARAMKKALAQNKEAFFLFGGEGDLIDAVKSVLCSTAVCDRVIFPGKITREDVKDYLAAGDVFVYASTSETQGTIITEAMYMGLPVAAVRASGVEDLVVDGEMGVLTRETTSDLAYAALRCIQDTDARKRYGFNARLHAQSAYTITACTQRLLHVYESAIAKYKK